MISSIGAVLTECGWVASIVHFIELWETLSLSLSLSLSYCSRNNCVAQQAVNKVWFLCDSVVILLLDCV